MPQVGQLIALLQEERIYVPSILSAMTGMRRGEVAAVRWKWVDLDAAQLTVVESVEQTNNAVAIKAPKEQPGARRRIGSDDCGYATGP